MTQINTSAITRLDKKFSAFAQNTISRRNPDRNYVISQLQMYQTQYNKNGLFRDFLLRLEDFAIGMEYNNLLDLAGMVYSKLAKFPTTPEMKEQFLRGGLRVAKKQGDDIHSLARIVDLKKLYETSGNDNKYYKILFSEEKILENITRNFFKAQKRFRTVAKNNSPIEKYKFQLAAVKVDIAKKQRSSEAHSRLVEARNLFTELGREKEVKFVNRLISRTKTNF